MKIAHLADTHIKNLKYHEEYNTIFNKIYEILVKEQVDCIVHCGDIAHTKTQISPEFVEMASNFFRNLASIAPTFVILGNHDGNLRNGSRQDAITPIVNALNLDSLFLLKDSGEVNFGEEFSFNVMSLFDEKNWKKPTDSNKINIALFHGSVAGVSTDTGYIMDHGDYSVDIFDGHDFVFLGDIHKTNQVLDSEGRVRYPGSTVQQNFGETDDKGFLIWDIKTRQEFTCNHFSIPNPNPFVTISLDSDGNLPKLSLKKGSRVRIIADNNITLDKIKKATEFVKTKYEPESVTFLNKANLSGSDEEMVSDIVSEDQNLRDLSVQEKLIRDYLKDFKVEDDVMDKVLTLNKRYSSQLEEGEEVYRGINWKLKSLEWDNLFNYGEGNKIDFEKLEGIVGIFGKNYSGKSSVVDSMLYTVYNATSKNNRKNINVINQNKAAGTGKIAVEIDGETYEISRTSEKYTKKLKGVTSTEAKTDVEFKSSGDSLNGLARSDTDKSIRKYFGTVDDFFLTSMASQFGYLSFIGEGSTNRKSILAKFLDLEMFEKKFKMAKEESAQLKALLKKLEGSDYDREIAVVELQEKNNTSQIETVKAELEYSKKYVEECKTELDSVKEALKNMPTEIIDYNKTVKQLELLVTNKESLEKKNDSLLEESKKLEELIAKINKFESLIDRGQLKQDDEEVRTLNLQMIQLEKEIKLLESNINGFKVKLKLLEDIPCGNQFTSCKFIKDAFQAKEKLDGDEGLLLGYKHNYNGISTRYDELDEKTANLHNKLGEATRKKNDAVSKKMAYEIEVEKNKVQIEKSIKIISDLQRNVKIYDENREVIENYTQKLAKKEQLENSISLSCSNIEHYNRELINLYKYQGSYAEKVENFKKLKEDLANTQKEYAAYDLYQVCMHSNGVSYEIIKKKLPIINQEIAKILSNVVDFSIYLVNDDDKLDIMIKHPKYDARPLEMGSGAEKTLASTAIRLALLNVTTLPRGDIFIMDEPGTALDEENLDGFVRILELIKSYFKTVLLISHLDSLKDCVDMQISIERKDDYAYVNQ